MVNWILLLDNRKKQSPDLLHIQSDGHIQDNIKYILRLC